MLNDPHRRNVKRLLWTLVLGLLLGGLLTQLALLLPESPAKTFLTLSVAASFGPLAIDLVVLALRLGRWCSA